MSGCGWGIVMRGNAGKPYNHVLFVVYNWAMMANTCVLIMKKIMITIMVLLNE